MAVALLVGAGASLAEAPASTARRSKPPLDGTFFELCRLAEIDGQGVVQRYMQQNYGLDPFDGTHGMEEIFNYIYGDAFAPDAPDESYNAYAALVRMYQAAIARTTNPLSGNSQRGVGAVLKHLWLDAGERDLTVITFNQDLLIEKALDKMSSLPRYAGLTWDIRQCYGRTFTFVGAGGPFFQAATPGESVKVLKLHGSLNWIYKVRSDEDPRNYVRKIPKRLHCVTDIEIKLGYRYRENRRMMPMIPFVVPPIYEKSSQYQEAIAPIWTQAEEVLSSVERLIIFGYSFPSADFEARRLLRRSFHANASLNKVTIINPSASVAQRVGDLLESASVAHHKKVSAYVDRDLREGI